MGDVRTWITPPFINANEKAAVSGVATLGTDQKIPHAQLPALAINDVYTVADEAEMLGLDAGAAAVNGGIHRGDMAVWADGHVYVASADGGLAIGDWVEISSPAVTPVKSDWAINDGSNLANIDNKPATVPNLTTNSDTDLLSASQGVVLADMIANIINGTTALTDAVHKATQIEVDAGIEDTKLVTSLTLANSSQWDTKISSDVTAATFGTQIPNMVTCTQAEYDGGTPVAGVTYLVI